MQGKRPILDFTTEPKDHLTSLPPELIHLICDYLFPEHYPNIAFHPNHSNYHSSKPHTLENLAATCHTLHSTINTWALHFLRQHSQITKYRDLADPQNQETRNFLRASTNHHLSNSTSKPGQTRSNKKLPLSLLPWKDRHCIFCGKPSQRHAILHLFSPVSSPSLTSYPRARDDPSDSTWREAKKKEGKQEGARNEDQSLRRRPRPIRYGSYISSNVATTMFLERDVRGLAEEVHGTGDGGWKGYKERRTAAAEERRKKRVVGKAEREGAE
ncbi:hypothetical protein D0867_15896, partial [Hortaea werneckii]